MASSKGTSRYVLITRRLRKAFLSWVSLLKALRNPVEADCWVYQTWDWTVFFLVIERIYISWEMYTAMLSVAGYMLLFLSLLRVTALGWNQLYTILGCWIFSGLLWMDWMAWRHCHAMACPLQKSSSGQWPWGKTWSLLDFEVTQCSLGRQLPIIKSINNDGWVKLDMHCSELVMKIDMWLELCDID